MVWKTATDLGKCVCVCDGKVLYNVPVWRGRLYTTAFVRGQNVLQQLGCWGLILAACFLSLSVLLLIFTNRFFCVCLFGYTVFVCIKKRLVYALFRKRLYMYQADWLLLASLWAHIMASIWLIKGLPIFPPWKEENNSNHLFQSIVVAKHGRLVPRKMYKKVWAQGIAMAEWSLIQANICTYIFLCQY